jgi:hypothetical protein
MTIELIDPTDGGVMEVEARSSAADLNALAYTLAYEFASAVIDGESLRGAEGWRSVDPEGEVDLVDALRYLELRGLLERHPEHRNWVRVLDESEATR